MTGRIPALKPRQVIAALRRAGFVIHHTAGSHYILVRPGDRKVRITVPYHNRDLKRQTLRSIITQSGLSVSDFLGLL